MKSSISSTHCSIVPSLDSSGSRDIAQVASTYGAGDAHTIVENCGNTLILRCSASEGGGTSRFASTLIGQREVLRTTRSISRRVTEFLGSVTRSEHLSIEPAVMDSEIEQLPDLAGYLKFASRERWLRVNLQPPRASPAHQGAPAFIAAPPIPAGAAIPPVPAPGPASAPAPGVLPLRRTRRRQAASRTQAITPAERRHNAPEHEP